MTQKHLWKFLIIVFVVVWSIVALTPPTGRDLLLEFQGNARAKDETFTNIVLRGQELQKQFPARAYGNLKEAIGTNDIARFFPQYNTRGEKNPSAYVLSRIQRDAAGKIKLGLDLQGGSSFLVGLDTSKLSTNSDRSVAIANAVEVLRKRVDSLGVAEPLLQRQANSRILIQLPGLSEADRESAKKLIETAAYLEFRMVHEDSEQLLQSGITPPGYEILRDRKSVV